MRGQVNRSPRLEVEGLGVGGEWLMLAVKGKQRK